MEEKQYITLDEFEKLYTNIDTSKVTVEDMQKTEDLMINKPIAIIYSLLAKNALIEEIIRNMKLKEPQVISDYYDNAKQISSEFKNILKVADNIGDTEYFDGFYYDKSMQTKFKHFMSVYEKVLEYFAICSKIEALKSQGLSKSEYYRLSTNFNKKIVATFDTASKMVNENEDVVLGDKEIYDKICDAYALMAVKYQLYYNVNKKKEQESKVSTPVQISDTEKERLEAIEKANRIYDELYLDWIRDLDNQTPFSTRDKAQLIKSKYIKIGERFNMPLKADTSLGMAKEVYNQINNLMNSISELSSESYSIGTYRE